MNYLWLLTLILVAAKLFGALHCSWFLVLLPGIISVSVGIAILALALGAMLLGVIWTK